MKKTINESFYLTNPLLKTKKLIYLKVKIMSSFPTAIQRYEKIPCAQTATRKSMCFITSF